MSIPFIDLKSQQSRIRDKVEAGFATVLDHGAYIMGPEIAALETRLGEWTDVAHNISCSSGTDALLLALRGLALQPGQGSGEPALTRLHLAPAGWCEVPLLQRRSLVSGQVIHGPALISEAIGCIVLEAGWTARLDKSGVLLLDRFTD